MERKVKMDMSAVLIVGIVFSVIGAAFLPIGIFVGGPLMMVDKEFVIFTIIFSGMGLIFLGLGITFLIWEMRKYKMQKRLLEGGYYIYAEVLDVSRNLNIQYGNHGHPYIVRCGHTDENGTLHIFKSRNITRYIGNDLIGQQVRVYLDRNDYNNYKNYYMDIDEILPYVVEH